MIRRRRIDDLTDPPVPAAVALAPHGGRVARVLRTDRELDHNRRVVEWAERYAANGAGASRR